MLLWSYFTAVATDPGRVPPGWHPFSDEEVHTSFASINASCLLFLQNVLWFFIGIGTQCLCNDALHVKSSALHQKLPTA